MTVYIEWGVRLDGAVTHCRHRHAAELLHDKHRRMGMTGSRLVHREMAVTDWQTDAPGRDDTALPDAATTEEAWLRVAVERVELLGELEFAIAAEAADQEGEAGRMLPGRDDLPGLAGNSFWRTMSRAEGLRTAQNIVRGRLGLPLLGDDEEV